MPVGITILAAIIAIVAHEVSHGWAALLLGDNTAKRCGRLSLNPIKHIDPLGSIILPFVLTMGGLPAFGWAKPVPIDFVKLKNYSRDIVLVSSAGIITNIILAFTTALIIYKFGPMMPALLSVFFINFMIINVVLALFNLLPFPPLDGSKIFFGWIKKDWAQKYIHSAKYGIWSLAGLLLLLPFLSRILGFGSDPLQSYLRHGIQIFNYTISQIIS